MPNAVLFSSSSPRLQGIASQTSASSLCDVGGRPRPGRWPPGTWAVPMVSAPADNLCAHAPPGSHGRDSGARGKEGVSPKNWLWYWKEQPSAGSNLAPASTASSRHQGTPATEHAAFWPPGCMQKAGRKENVCFVVCCAGRILLIHCCPCLRTSRCCTPHARCCHRLCGLKQLRFSRSTRGRKPADSGCGQGSL